MKSRHKEIISIIAYRIYRQRLRDNAPGDDKKDWFDAEEIFREDKNG